MDDDDIKFNELVGDLIKENQHDVERLQVIGQWIRGFEVTNFKKTAAVFPEYVLAHKLWKKYANKSIGTHVHIIPDVKAYTKSLKENTTPPMPVWFSYYGLDYDKFKSE